MTKLAYVAMALAVIGCDAGGHENTHVAPAPPAPVAPAPPSTPVTTKGSAMTDLRDKLPADFDVRVTRALALTVPDNIVVELDHVAMAKLPFTNYRLQLASDGAVFYVQHSGKGGDWQVPFDLPIATKPATKISTTQLAAVTTKLEAGGFFDHPGYQADPTTQDGSYWIVRARRGGKELHSVVFQNVQPDYVAALAAIADPLAR